MFDWLGSLFGNAFSSLGTQISSAIFDMLLKWMYEQIYNTVADFFTQMGNMGAEIFDLGVVQSTISLFTLFGWALFAAGTVVAVFDVALEYQNGRASIKTTAINVLKGFIDRYCSRGTIQVLYFIAELTCKRLVAAQRKRTIARLIRKINRVVEGRVCYLCQHIIWIV